MLTFLKEENKKLKEKLVEKEKQNEHLKLLLSNVNGKFFPIYP